MKPRVNAIVFSALAADLSKTLGYNTARATRQRRFKKVFGVNALICAKVWDAVLPHLPCSASPVHLLWTLYFLRQYGLEEVNAAFAKSDEKTYRKWCWEIINAIAQLELVSKNEVTMVGATTSSRNKSIFDSHLSFCVALLLFRFLFFFR
jgi:hypothetical protein